MEVDLNRRLRLGVHIATFALRYGGIRLDDEPGACNFVYFPVACTDLPDASPTASAP